VARAIGAVTDPDGELTATALKFASRWPDAPETRGPGAPFGPKIDV
jgi:hypothetical protein